VPPQIARLGGALPESGTPVPFLARTAPLLGSPQRISAGGREHVPCPAGSARRAQWRAKIEGCTVNEGAIERVDAALRAIPGRICGNNPLQGKASLYTPSCFASGHPGGVAEWSKAAVLKTAE
jgi:hypothetical protein